MDTRSLAPFVAVAALLAVLLVLLPLDASASSHTEVKAIDVKQLEGTWRGKQTDRFGTGDVEWVIANGEVAATVRHPGRSYTANGTLSALGGRLFWNAQRSRGDVLLHESDGKRWLKYNLMGTASNVPIVGEVHEVK